MVLAPDLGQCGVKGDGHGKCPRAEWVRLLTGGGTACEVPWLAISEDLTPCVLPTQEMPPSLWPLASPEPGDNLGFLCPVVVLSPDHFAFGPQIPSQCCISLCLCSLCLRLSLAFLELD